MTTYTLGPLLAMFLCALLGRGSFRGLLIGSIISFVGVLFIRNDVWVLIHSIEIPFLPRMSYEWLGNLPMYWVNSEGALKTTVGFYWAWPATTIVTFLFGYFWRRRNARIV